MTMKKSMNKNEHLVKSPKIPTYAEFLQEAKAKEAGIDAATIAITWWAL